MTPIAAQAFPATRLRRLRQSSWSRALVGENTLSPSDLIWSMVVHDGDKPKIEVESMPGTYRYNIEEAAKAAKRAQDLGIPAIAIFPNINPARKDDCSSDRFSRMCARASF